MNYNNNPKKVLFVLRDSFFEYLESGSRSTKKLKILHGAINQDLQERLPKEFKIYSLDEGRSREIKVKGLYYDKYIDIVIKHNGNVVACVGIKFIMQNYKQNANNYFENLLGETVNIQEANIPYFNLLFFNSPLPYFEKGGNIKKYETFTQKDLKKYLKLYSTTKEKSYAPRLFFIGVIKNDIINIKNLKNNLEYKKEIMQHKKIFNFEWEKIDYQNNNQNFVINDYDLFINKIIDYLNTNIIKFK